MNKGAVEPATSDRYVTRCRLVAKPGSPGKWRLVVDLRKQPCRFETLKRLSRLATKEDWMFSLDLEDGFYCVPVHPADRQFLTVHLEGFGLLQFAALPMGLTTSPFAFTKVMRTFVQALRAPMAVSPTPLAQRTPPPPPPPASPPPYRPPHLRGPASAPTAPAAPRVLLDLVPRFGALMKTGLRLLPYMDDFLFLCRSLAEALEARNYVEAILDLLGLRRNVKKGFWEPVQELKHLGLGVDSAKGQFFVTPDRLLRLREFATTLLGRASRCQGLVPRRQLAAFAGLAQSLYLALPAAQHFLRTIHNVISSERSWQAHVRLSSSARTDLQWFADLAARWNGRDIWRAPTTATLHCDASTLAWGGVLNMTKQARGFWQADQQNEHITLLELRSVLYTIQTFRRELEGHTVQLWEDNQAVVAVLKSWTTKSPDMMRVLRKLWLLNDSLNITLVPRYIRSADNVQADELSRRHDPGDWRLNPAVFATLDKLWGPHTVDRFATTNNTHLPRFNSALGDPLAEAVDAFSQANWPAENNWCNPPWSELDRLAQLLRETKAAATVVVPHWPAQAWFQQLQEMACDSRSWQPQANLFCPGRLGSSEPVGPPSWPITCFRILDRR